MVAVEYKLLFKRGETGNSVKITRLLQLSYWLVLLGVKGGVERTPWERGRVGKRRSGFRKIDDQKGKPPGRRTPARRGYENLK